MVPEVKWLVPPVQKRVVQALPLRETPVVETESFWATWNRRAIYRQSAAALDVIAVIAMNAIGPAFSIMSAPQV